MYRSAAERDYERQQNRTMQRAASDRARQHMMQYQSNPALSYVPEYSAPDKKKKFKDMNEEERAAFLAEARAKNQAMQKASQHVTLPANATVDLGGKRYKDMNDYEKMAYLAESRARNQSMQLAQANDPHGHHATSSSSGNKKKFKDMTDEEKAAHLAEARMRNQMFQKASLMGDYSQLSVDEQEKAMRMAELVRQNNEKTAMLRYDPEFMLRSAENRMRQKQEAMARRLERKSVIQRQIAESENKEVDGIGKRLLMRSGWTPGQGVGRNKAHVTSVVSVVHRKTNDKNGLGFDRVSWFNRTDVTDSGYSGNTDNNGNGNGHGNGSTDTGTSLNVGGEEEEIDREEDEEEDSNDEDEEVYVEDEDLRSIGLGFVRNVSQSFNMMQNQNPYRYSWNPAKPIQFVKASDTSLQGTFAPAES